MPRHWEGDLIKGVDNHSSLGVLVERSTRLVLLCKMPDATAESSLAAFTARLHQVAQPLRQTPTYDQGKELTRHRELAQATVLGKEAVARTPMDCYGSFYPKARI